MVFLQNEDGNKKYSKLLIIVTWGDLHHP